MITKKILILRTAKIKIPVTKPKYKKKILPFGMDKVQCEVS